MMLPGHSLLVGVLLVVGMPVTLAGMPVTLVGVAVVTVLVAGTEGDRVDALGAQQFAELIEVVRESGVPAIFAETTQSARLAETLAREVGRDVEVVTLFTDSLGPPGSGADTYSGMLTTNARRIADALASC